MSFMHAWTAARRGDALLGHDEAISLLAAAGKSPRIDHYYERLDALQVMPARELRDLLRPTGDTGLADVWESLARRDMHPPLYFAALHLLQRAGLDSLVALRLLGSLILFLAALIADRLIWPGVPIGARLLGFLLLTIPPSFLGLAVELRHYAFVFLGTILSLAAIVSFGEGRGSVRSRIILMGLAPAILLWSHLGTAVWIAVYLVAVWALMWLSKSQPRDRRVFMAAVLTATLLLLPLLILFRTPLAHVASAEAHPLAVGLALSLMKQVLHGAATAWCSLPTRCQTTGADTLAFVAVCAACVWIIRTRPRVDRVLLGAALLWFVAWSAWLANGVIPSHAVTGKYVLPLALCPLIVWVRATAVGNGGGLRRPIAIAVLSIAALSHGIGVWQVLAHQPDRPLLSAIRASRCVLFDQPKRGYLLPVTAEMPADATVLVAPASVALGNWADCAAHLPDDRMLLVEIDTVIDGRRRDSARMLYERLAGLYEARETLRRGPHRTITEFRRRVAPLPNLGSIGVSPVEMLKEENHAWPRPDTSSSVARR